MTNFFNTVAALRPRIWCLENVKRLICKKFIEDFKKLLKTATGYHFTFKLLRSADWSIPQARERLYVVGVRKDCLRLRTWSASLMRFDSILESSKGADPCPDFMDFLAAHGCPVVGESSRVTPADIELERQCCCGPKSACPVHPCFCQLCVKAGPAARLCKWRKHINQYMLSQKRNRRTYLANWRKVMSDQHLKAAPSYFELARRAKIAASKKISSPRERLLLDAVSGSENLLRKSVILDLSQSIHRLVIRRDGKVPTIGKGSTRLFVTSKGVFLNHRQCLALNGLGSKTFEAQGVKPSVLHYMAGNAMCLPVVGSVLVAAGEVVRWD